MPSWEYIIFSVCKIYLSSLRKAISPENGVVTGLYFPLAYLQLIFCHYLPDQDTIFRAIALFPVRKFTNGSFSSSHVTKVVTLLQQLFTEVKELDNNNGVFRMRRLAGLANEQLGRAGLRALKPEIDK